MRAEPLRAERFAGIDETDAVIETGLPDGICIWRYPRKTVKDRKGNKSFTRLYSVTHERSGYRIIDGAFRTLADARRRAWALADVRYRGKPIDLTLPVEDLRKIDRFTAAALALGGWFMIGERYDRETRAWAERNGIDLEAWKKKAAA